MIQFQSLFLITIFNTILHRVISYKKKKKYKEEFSFNV